jgi:hypothetical protein
MAFSYSVIKDGDRFVEVKCINTGGAVAATKIVDASTLNYSNQLDTELLNLVKVFVSADQDEKVGAKIFWADSAGVVTADPAILIGHGLNGHNRIYVENDYTDSNGDIFFSSEDSTYTIILTFQKVRGFYSSKAKPWSP